MQISAALVRSPGLSEHRGRSASAQFCQHPLGRLDVELVFWIRNVDDQQEERRLAHLRQRGLEACQQARWEAANRPLELVVKQTEPGEELASCRARAMLVDSGQARGVFATLAGRLERTAAYRVANHTGARVLPAR
jgi:hypothetical protein